ncbi:MAG: helicase HerA-like domain-containing protein [Nitrospirota bacterium]
MSPESLPMAYSPTPLSLLPRMANRHGLIAGATGTGKTVTLRVLAEQFSRIGVPVVMADVKGDLSGLAQPGAEHPKVSERVQKLGLKDFAFAPCPVVFWDVFGEQGHPLRATVSDMGPLLLGRLLNLNETQGGVLSAVFSFADEQGLLLLDMKDLRALLQHAAVNAKTLKARYGNVTSATVGAIQRGLLALEEQGGDRFFGEPALDLNDLMRAGLDGRGVVNILAADKLFQAPTLYATVLLWMLAELFENLPEVGDPDKPKLVVFFDEAHLLFADAPKALQDKIEQVVRLIRSKGVGVYFVTQTPLDIPDAVLGQLGNRVQHALRAFTPRDQKAVKAAAQTFRDNPKLDVESAITELGVGEALVSFLDEQGRPSVVERALVRPPASRLAPLAPAERQEVMRRSPVSGRYEQTVDRESAHERLSARVGGGESSAGPARLPADATLPPKPTTRQVPSVVGAAAMSAARAIGSQIGRELIRGVLGSLLGGGTAGRRRR